MKFNANYDPNSKIMSLNEMQWYKIKSVSINKIFQNDKKMINMYSQ